MTKNLKHRLSTFHFCISLKKDIDILLSNCCETQTYCRLQNFGVETAYLAVIGKRFMNNEMSLTAQMSYLMTSGK